jgi:hypothetical protein
MIESVESTRGATFSEVLVAMALTSVGLIGAMSAFQATQKSLGQATLVTRALAMAESRLEAKRSVKWERLLMDDLDHDGVPEVVMHDDGADGDRMAGDGIYSARREQDGVMLMWTVAPNRGNLATSGFVVVEACASYRFDNGEHEVRIATLRANPVLAGSH